MCIPLENLGSQILMCLLHVPKPIFIQVTFYLEFVSSGKLLFSIDVEIQTSPPSAYDLYSFIYLPKAHDYIHSQKCMYPSS